MDRLTPNNYQLNWTWAESLVIAFLALEGVNVLLGLVLQSVRFSLAPGVDIVGNFSFYAGVRLLGFLLVYLFIRSRGAGLQALGFRKFNVAKTVLLMVGAVIILLVGTQVAFTAVDQTLPGVNLQQAQQNVFTEARGGLEIGLSFLALVVIAPIAEETIFRGFMLPVFVDRFNFWIGALATSLLFGIIHLQINVAIVTFILGLVLAWLYYKTNSLWPAILFHSLKNLLAFILIFSL